MTKSRISLPFTMPQPCPICGKKVILTAITEWGADDGLMTSVEFDCETEPDIDSDEWPDWFNGHFSMPYVDWLPWEEAAKKWLNGRYYFQFKDTPS